MDENQPLAAGSPSARVLAFALEAAGALAALAAGEWALGNRLRRPLQPQELAALYGGLLLILGALHAVVLARTGSTPAMSLFGLRVLRLDGSPPGLKESALRLAASVPSLLPLGAGAWPVLLSADGRALHDRLSGTIVVERAGRPTVASVLQTLGALLVLIGGPLLALWVAAGAAAYDDVRKVVAARRAMASLARLQALHYQRHGRFAGSLGELAFMTADGFGYINALDRALDARGSLNVEAGPGGFRITAKARDRERTDVYVQMKAPSR